MSESICVVLEAVADVAQGLGDARIWTCATIGGPEGVPITGLGDDFFEARKDLAVKLKDSGLLPEGTEAVRLFVATRKTFTLEELT